MTDKETKRLQELDTKTDKLEPEIKRLQEQADYRLKLLTKMLSERNRIMRKPVAYIKDREISYMRAVKNEGAKEWHTNLGLVPEEGDVPLYEGREWVGLTDEEALDVWGKVDLGQTEEQGALLLCKAIEAKLKEKNAQMSATDERLESSDKARSSSNWDSPGWREQKSNWN